MHVISRHLPAVVAVVALVGGLAACSDDDTSTITTTTTSTTTTTAATTTSTTTTTATTSTTTTTSTTAPGTTVPEEVHQVRAYFVAGERVTPVTVDVLGVAVAAGAMSELLAGPTSRDLDRGLATAIPDGTELLGIRIEGTTAFVDLSSAFTTGGGTASMMARVAQVVFTLTQFPDVDGVEFLVDGEPLRVLGGEGLELDGPQRRADWEDLSPAILIESPLPDAEVSRTVRVTGTANVFEAQFRISVVTADGEVVEDQPVMATSGTGTRGTFDVTLHLDADVTGAVEVIAYELSARDGERINEFRVPVVVTAP